MGFEVRRALDMMMFSLLDPPAANRPELRRTAWAILQTIEPSESLGQSDAARHEAVAMTDTGPIIDPESFNDAIIDTCSAEEARLTVVLSPPGQPLLTHPAATSADHLRYAAHRGLTLDGASPDLQAAILRFFDTDVALRTHASAVLKARQEHRQDDVQLDTRHTQAAICITTVLRLLYLPQLVPGHMDVTVSLAMSAVLWRLARDLKSGPAEWKADLNLLRSHLKALGREHDCHRLMRALESYGPALQTRHAMTVVEEALTLHGLQIRDAHQEIPDVEQDVLDVPCTPADSSPRESRTSRIARPSRAPSGARA